MNNTINTENNNINLGEYLVKIRKNLGLSKDAVAQHLCLKTSIITDIEENTNLNNIEPAFFRGYVRSYAKLINISDDEICKLLDKNVPIKSVILTSTQNYFLKKIYKRRIYWIFHITWFIILICITMILLWWWQGHKSSKDDIINMNIYNNNVGT
uniref:Cytoskeleton protein RodZ n=1 Tax=Candidatus Aschnera chinzeii TaxID=1485666 RepID=A0AAT9G568_9ENTR|nr:MAG: hypothetical protein ACHINZ_5300 [Candidatus Aschnera chinzeii]